MQRYEAGAAREQAIEKTTARLLELDQLKDRFVATVSHELRTPLTSIHGYLHLVLEGEVGDLTDEQRKFLSIAGRNTDRLRRLVEDLLLISELDAMISNALKFTARGGSVSVRTTHLGGSAVLEIEDTGIGIAADEQQRRLPGDRRLELESQ